MRESYYSRYEWNGKAILVVEDDLSSSFFLKEVLSETGADLFFASNGKQAIETVQNQPSVSLVLMDMQMNVMDGFQATREILKIRPELPVIAQTAYVFPSDREKCLQAGCCEFIPKPVNITELLEKINMHI